jgi:lipopolysaccharide heptosyltransferase I
VAKQRKTVPLTELEANRIALIKPSALGDIIHSLPVLTALRRRFPRAHISWVVNRGYEPLLYGHPDLDETLPFDRHASHAGFWRTSAGFIAFLKNLRRRSFDLVIDLQGLLRSGIMTLATGAKRRVGMSSAREGARWFYTDLVPVPDFETSHAVDRTWRVADAFGAGTAEKRFRLRLAEDARVWADEVLATLPRPWLAAGVGARWRTKRWPPEHFAALLRRAQQYFGGTALFVGGRDEIPLAEAAARLLDGPVQQLAGRTSLPQLAALLSRVDIMLANDTGPLHLAVALGRPVVAPYTCTQVCRNGPYGQAQRAVETTVWCAGSYRKKCNRLECMAELTPARLWPILDEILCTWQKHSLSA